MSNESAQNNHHGFGGCQAPEDSFRANFVILKGFVEQVKNQKVSDIPDIDGLATILPQASRAWKACKSRTAAVQAMLNEQFQDT